MKGAIAAILVLAAATAAPAQTVPPLAAAALAAPDLAALPRPALRPGAGPPPVPPARPLPPELPGATLPEPLLPALPPLPLRPEARPGSEPPRAPLASDRPVPRPGRAYASDGQRLSEPHPDCDGQGLICIRLARRVEDTCSAIETLAKAHDLPPGFFARLIWRESLFDPYAISPAGALGIAQFMPGTARLRGLADPFNPAAALAASAAYLADLRDAYGNLGLAAAAYNGGEERVARFMAGSGGLPGETRAYVAGITGHSAMAWRDAPPDAVDLALADGRPFSESCIELASTRKFPQFRTDPPLAPWAVIVAAHTSRSVAAARYRTAARMNPVLQRHDPVIARVKLASMRGAQYTAQLGAGSRGEAVQLCNQIRQYGSVCTVLRN